MPGLVECACQARFSLRPTAIDPGRFPSWSGHHLNRHQCILAVRLLFSASRCAHGSTPNANPLLGASRPHHLSLLAPSKPRSSWTSSSSGPQITPSRGSALSGELTKWGRRGQLYLPRRQSDDSLTLHDPKPAQLQFLVDHYPDGHITAIEVTVDFFPKNTMVKRDFLPPSARIPPAWIVPDRFSHADQRDTEGLRFL